MNQVDPSRSEIAAKLVESGVPIPRAVIQAGYSEATSKQLCRSPNLQQKLIEARESYVEKYLAACDEVGLTGDNNARVLMEVVKSGTHFDKVNAIKTHHQFISRIAENPTSISFNGVFVVPNLPDKWEGNAKVIVDAQVIKDSKT